LDRLTRGSTGPAGQGALERGRTGPVGLGLLGAAMLMALDADAPWCHGSRVRRNRGPHELWFARSLGHGNIRPDGHRSKGAAVLGGQLILGSEIPRNSGPEDRVGEGVEDLGYRGANVPRCGWFWVPRRGGTEVHNKPLISGASEPPGRRSGRHVGQGRGLRPLTVKPFQIELWHRGIGQLPCCETAAGMVAFP
jgi:hypothetical protein